MIGKRILPYFLSLLVFFFVASCAYASTTVGMIDPNNVGHNRAVFMNDASTTADDTNVNTGKFTTATSANVTVTSSQLAGFMWSEVAGWISLNCVANGGANCASSGNWGIVNDGNGNLSGYAWGENTGWISFYCGNTGLTNCATNGNYRVVINPTTGQFSGFAWSQNYGWLQFNCNITNACTETDWRPGSGTTTGGGSGGGGSGSGTGGTSGTTGSMGATSGTTGTNTTSGTTGTGTAGTNGTTTSGTTGTGTAGTNGTTTSGTTGDTSGTTSGDTTTGGDTSGSTGSDTTGTTGDAGGTTAGGSSGSGGGSGGGTGGGSIIPTIDTIVSTFVNSTSITKVNTIVQSVPHVIAQSAPTVATATTVGLGVGGGLAVAQTLLINPFSMTDLFLLPTRLWSLFLGIFGIRRRKWGVVYDSKTKYPLDPVYVTLYDAFGRELDHAITDMDGRYGFVVRPGTYRLTAGKTHYLFPSVVLAGKTEDDQYKDLYFGELITIKSEDDVLLKNIPLDEIEADWNEKEKLSRHRLSPRVEHFLLGVMSLIFYMGFGLGSMAVLVNPSHFNLGIFAFYVIVFLLKEYGIAHKVKPAFVVNKVTHLPIAFAKIKCISTTTNIEVLHKVTDYAGRYYCLIANGSYIVKIETRTSDGSYVPAYTSEPIKVTKGYINQLFEI